MQNLVQAHIARLRQNIEVAEVVNFEVGIRHGVSLADYLSIPAVSASMLCDVDEHCAAYAQWARTSTQEAERRWTVQRKGMALHAMLLEPERFAKHYVAGVGCEAPLASGERKGQPCGASTGRLTTNGFLCGRHDDGSPGDGREAISIDDAQELIDMAAAARSVAGPAFERASLREVTLCWNDDETGLPMKGRLDLVDGNTIYDLKCLADIAPQRWGQILMNNGMHYQAVHYLTGAQKLGIDVDRFAWIAVRNSPPYLAVVHPPLDDISFDVAETLWRDRLNDLAASYSKERWPSYDIPERSSLPRWVVETLSVSP